MFKDKTNLHYFLLGFSGLAMIILAIYFQYISMDLNQYSLSQYLRKDIYMPEWWQLVILPLSVGVIFIALSGAGLIYTNFSRNIINILFFTLALSALVLPFHVYSGAIGLITSITCLASQLIYRYKHNKQRNSDSGTDAPAGSLNVR